MLAKYSGSNILYTYTMYTHHALYHVYKNFLMKQK